MHTKEPWEAVITEYDKRQGTDITIQVLTPVHKNPKFICRVYGPGVLARQSEETLANARRIVSCVNACRGLNPEVVPEILEMCEALLREYISLHKLMWNQVRNPVDENITVVAARAALQKAREG